MGRRELFKQAQQAMDAERENKGGNRDFEERFMTALKPDHYIPLRVYGEPIHVRTLDESPIAIQWSNIVGDDGKQFRCIWDSSNKWILWKIYKTVMAYDYDELAKTKAFHHDKTHPEIFARVSKNNRVDSIYESGWKPSKYVLMNVLNRGNMAKHKELKHWAILSRNVNIVEKEDKTMFYYDLGFPYSVYEMLLNYILEENGDWEDYDIAIERFSKEKAKMWYGVKSANDVHKLPEDIGKMISKTPLTEEELSWGKYNLTQIAKPTSYKTIYNRLHKFIAEVDHAFKTDYLDELRELVAKEKETWEIAKKEKLANSSNDDDDEHDENEEPEATATTKPQEETTTRGRRSVSEGARKDFWTQAREADWKGIDSLTAEEKALIKNIDVKAGKIDWVNPEEEGEDCQICGLPNLSFSLNVCPRCNTKYS